MRRLRHVVASSVLLMAAGVLPFGGTLLPAQAASSKAADYVGWQAGVLVGGGQYGILSNVSCTSATDCNALGASPTGQNALYSTRDSGQTWTQTLAPPAPGESFTGLSCTDSRHCWITSAALGLNPADQTSSIFLLDPSRGIFTKQTLPTDAATGFLSAVTCISTSTCWAVGSTIIATTDGGSTWSDQTIPMASTPYHLRSVAFADSVHGVAVGADTLLRTVDGGATWSAQTFGGASFSSVSCPSPLRCWAVGELEFTDNLVLASTDGGATWNEQAVPATLVGFIPTSISCATGRLICRMAGVKQTGAAIAETADGGVVWQSVTLPAEVGSPGASLTGISCAQSELCVAVGVHPDHSGAIISAVNGAVRTADTECADVAMVTARGSGEPLGQDTEADTAAVALASRLPLSATFRTVKLEYTAAAVNFGTLDDLINSLPPLFDSINKAK